MLVLNWVTLANSTCFNLLPLTHPLHSSNVITNKLVSSSFPETPFTLSLRCYLTSATNSGAFKATSHISILIVSVMYCPQPWHSPFHKHHWKKNILAIQSFIAFPYEYIPHIYKIISFPLKYTLSSPYLGRCNTSKTDLFKERRGNAISVFYAHTALLANVCIPSIPAVRSTSHFLLLLLFPYLVF